MNGTERAQGRGWEWRVDGRRVEDGRMEGVKWKGEGSGGRQGGQERILVDCKRLGKIGEASGRGCE